MWIFIDCHLCPISRSTYYYSTTTFTFFNGTSYMMYKIRIVNTFRTMCTVVVKLITLRLKIGYNLLFQFISRMVAGNRYYLIHKIKLLETK